MNAGSHVQRNYMTCKCFSKRVELHLGKYTYGHTYTSRKSELENLQQLLWGTNSLKSVAFGLWTSSLAATYWFIHFQTPDEPQSQTKVQENMTIRGNRRVEIKPRGLQRDEVSAVEVDASWLSWTELTSLRFPTRGCSASALCRLAVSHSTRINRSKLK